MPGYVKDTLHKFQKSTPQNISALYPPMGTSQLWFQHTPNGATTWQLTSNSSIIIQHSPSGSRNISVLCACRQPNHSGQNQQHSSLIIQNHTYNRKKIGTTSKICGHTPKGNHLIPQQWNYFTHAQLHIFSPCNRSQEKIRGVPIPKTTTGKPRSPPPKATPP